jgi:prepilin peptidase CpaA
MDFNDSFELSKIVLLISLLLFCSVTDLSMRRIPNMVLLPTLTTALFLNSAAGGLAGLVDSLAGLAIGLLMLMPLHVFGRMGAGDIKLLGVVGSILGGWGAIVAGLATMMAGGLLAVVYMVWLFIKPDIILRISRVLRPITGSAALPDEHTTWHTVRAAEIPYAVAIAAGTFATLAYLGLLTEVSIT